jgi:2-polyprenyl-3-methyl-5-hydroxy-6-metoxy-1,4-benzoquinol methylase
MQGVTPESRRLGISVTFDVDTSAFGDMTTGTSAMPWPSSDLQTLGACPICSDKRRTLMFSGLRDLAFAVASGEWSMWRCQSCTGAYLDPRPTPGSIGRAYARYYTHQAVAAGQKREPFRSAKRALSSFVLNDHVNRTYGHRLPAVPLGEIISRFFPPRQRRAEHSIRHLAAPKSADSALLDVGCGNGDFVKVAAALGFRSVGIDFDEKAIASGRLAGFDLRVGTLPGCGLIPNSFEHITARHVLEHIHQPKEAILELYRLLRPGGRLWVCQPNLGAIGLKEFGLYWRGLEPPRHLTLFDTDGMRHLLESCNFVNVRLLQAEPVARFYYYQSQCQASGVDPYLQIDPPGWGETWIQRAERADAQAAADPRVGESLTMVAWKPE